MTVAITPIPSMLHVMARLSCGAIPGIHRHVIQRGNRRWPTFFGEGDYQLYLDLLAEAAREG